MTQQVLNLLLTHFPNYIGFALTIYLQWRIIRILLEKVNGHDDDDD